MAGGLTGPIPKRSEERIRRNTPDVEIEKVTAIGPVPVPPLGIVDPHPMVAEIYESMKKSAQRKYYEPSDWAYAKTTLHFLNKLLFNPQPSAMMLTAVDSMMAKLLLTEGDRRRVRIEVERQPTAPSGDAKVLSMADRFAEALGVQSRG